MSTATQQPRKWKFRRYQDVKCPDGAKGFVSRLIPKGDENRYAVTSCSMNACKEIKPGEVYEAHGKLTEQEFPEDQLEAL